MAYCGPRGIPHSHFLGGPPVWTREDRDKALWWHIHELGRCPECGTRYDEWDPTKGGHDHAYVHELRKCWGCVEKAKGEDKVTDKMGPGVSVSLTRNPEAL
jgi:hypothetical protein